MAAAKTPVAGVAITIAIGAVGGAIFFYLHLPLAWMLGALTASTLAALFGAPLAFSLPLRNVMLAVLGALLGSAFTPDIADRLSHWAGGLGVMLVFIVGMGVLAVIYFIRIGGYDRITGYFCATPGGLGEMTIIGEQEGGDPRVIPLVHATRVLLVIFLLPLYLNYVEGFDVPAMANLEGDRPPITWGEMVLLGVLAASGSIAATWLRLPGACLVGPMLICATAYAGGLIEGRPPTLLVALAQIVIGASLGARFVGLKFREVGRTMLFAAGSALLMLAGAIVVSKLTAPFLGFSSTAILLALAPGGMAEMSLVALALNYDTAFVATMHIVRILFIIMLAPLVFRLLGWGRRKAG